MHDGHRAWQCHRVLTLVFPFPPSRPVLSSLDNRGSLCPVIHDGNNVPSHHCPKPTALEYTDIPSQQRAPSLREVVPRHAVPSPLGTGRYGNVRPPSQHNVPPWARLLPEPQRVHLHLNDGGDRRCENQGGRGRMVEDDVHPPRVPGEVISGGVWYEKVWRVYERTSVCPGTVCSVVVGRMCGASNVN